MNVFITDGNQRTALAVTRSLGRRGIEVLVGEEKGGSLASSSKYCSSHVTYPSPYRAPEEFYRFLLNFVQQNRVDLVIPMTDVTTYLISQRKEKFQSYTLLPIPDFKNFDFISDKWCLLKHAQEIGIPIPRTHFIQGLEGLEVLSNRLDYPVVVKPSRSKILTQNGWISTSVHYVKSMRELLRLYQEKEYLRYPSMVQERIVGPGVGIFVLFNRGELVTVFSHMRLREKPPSGGVSVLRKSIPVDPNLKEYAKRLFMPLGWHGVAMMEYKLDQTTKKHLLMEVNGRFWGSLQLAIDAGIDFPYLLYQLATDGSVEAPKAYRVGIKNRWFLGDLDHTLLRLFKKDQDLHLPEGFSSKTRTLIQFLKFYETGLHYEVLSLKDPRPFFYELLLYIKALFRDKKRFND